MKFRHLLFAASAAILAACATSTPYQPASKPGGFDGFSQTLIENDRARVTFGGNSLTERETVENYLLYRAAEMTKEKGFDHFSLIKKETEEKTRLSGGAGLSSSLYDPYFNYSFFRPRYGWSRGYRFSHFGGFRGGRGFGHRGFGRRGFGRSFYGGGFYDPFFNNYNIREITKYRATAEVKFGRGAKPFEKDNAFDAEEVLKNLAPTIEYPEEKT